VNRDQRNDWLPVSAFHEVQPDWSKRLFKLVGIPALLLMMLSLATGVGFEHQWIPITLFAVWAIVALLGNVVFFRARSRRGSNG
jgi:hypothetical protein